ncbi:MAG: type II toxin-antitoxin system HicA family toxin [Methylophilaceae bacterium]
MSKKDKLLNRFLIRPPVKDFTWDDFVTLMKQFDFKLNEKSGGGSHKYFVLNNDESKVIDTCKPHPNGLLKAWQIKEVTEKLKEWQLIDYE